ncbi:hypothetical protein [Roseobacter litoralis]|uniref:hypothetical protein n=1 Tax=Roseobacter litoralis TaxID=42443 RepID=UPI001390F3B9|nr:hypothetical protein [Roseobacter litoralis]
MAERQRLLCPSVLPAAFDAVGEDRSTLSLMGRIACTCWVVSRPYLRFLHGDLTLLFGTETYVEA